MFAMHRAVHFAVAFVLAAFSLQAAVVGPLTPIPIDFTAGGGGNPVIIHFAGSDASFNSVLNLVEPPGFAGNPFFFNHGTAEGTAINLGTFAAGTVLRFRLDVLGLNQSFFSGPAFRNPDNMVHVAAGTWQADAVIPFDGIYIGFEDLMGGGDMDFDDNSFVIRAGGAVDPRQLQEIPEPSYVFLVAAGLGSAFIIRRRFSSPLN
jgi:hypothetical protein